MDFTKMTQDKLQALVSAISNKLENRKDQSYDKAYNAICKAIKKYMYTTDECFPIAFINEKAEKYDDCYLDFFTDGSLYVRPNSEN